MEASKKMKMWSLFSKEAKQYNSFTLRLQFIVEHTQIGENSFKNQYFILYYVYIRFIDVCVWSLHVFPVSVCVPSGCFGFLPQSKDMHIRLLIDCKIAHRCECECAWCVNWKSLSDILNQFIAHICPFLSAAVFLLFSVFRLFWNIVMFSDFCTSGFKTHVCTAVKWKIEMFVLFGCQDFIR